LANIAILWGRRPALSMIASFLMLNIYRRKYTYWGFQPNDLPAMQTKARDSGFKISILDFISYIKGSESIINFQI